MNEKAGVPETENTMTETSIVNEDPEYTKKRKYNDKSEPNERASGNA